MRRAVLEEVLTSLEQVTREGARIVTPEGLRVELVCSGRTEVLVVGPLRELRLADDYVAATTESDTFFVEYDHVYGVRAKGKASGRPSRTGFMPG